MSNLEQSAEEHDTDQLRCSKCDKLLAKKLGRDFQIKCLRCGTLNILFDKMKERIIATDSQGKIIFVNQAVEEETGYKANEAIGKRCLDLYGSRMTAEDTSEMFKKLEAKKAFTMVFAGLRKNDEPFEAELVITPVMDIHHGVIFWVGIGTEIKKHA